MAQELAAKDGKIALLESEKYTDGKLVDIYKDLNGQITALGEKVQANKDAQDAVNCQQAVFNGTTTATLGCIQQQVACSRVLLRWLFPRTLSAPSLWTDITPGLRLPPPPRLALKRYTLRGAAYPPLTFLWRERYGKYRASKARVCEFR